VWIPSKILSTTVPVHIQGVVTIELFGRSWKWSYCPDGEGAGLVQRISRTPETQQSHYGYVWFILRHEVLQLQIGRPKPSDNVNELTYLSIAGCQECGILISSPFSVETQLLFCGTNGSSTSRNPRELYPAVLLRREQF